MAKTATGATKRVTRPTARSSRGPHEFWMTPRGATHCADACAVGVHVVVLVSHASDGGEESLALVPLDATGRQLGGSGKLEIADQTGYLATLVAGGGGRILAAVTTRDREELADRNELRIHDRPRLLDLGTPSGPRVRELGSWDVDVACLRAASLGEQTTWTMSTVTYGPGGPSTQLAYAFGLGTSLPELRRADIACSVLAHLVGEQGIVALAGTAKSLDLWVLPRSGEPRCLGEIARAKTRTSFSSARILRLRDGFAFVWYVSATSSSGPVGGVWARTCSMALDDLAAPVRLARDDDASWNEWRAYDVGDGGLVLYGSGNAGDPVQQLRLRERNDVGNDACRFPGRLPDALIATSDGVVVITTRVSNDGRRTRLMARLLTL